VAEGAHKHDYGMASYPCCLECGESIKTERNSALSALRQLRDAVQPAIELMDETEPATTEAGRQRTRRAALVCAARLRNAASAADKELGE